MQVTNNETGESIDFDWHDATPPTEQDIDNIWNDAKMQGKVHKASFNLSDFLNKSIAPIKDIYNKTATTINNPAPILNNATGVAIQEGPARNFGMGALRTTESLINPNSSVLALPSTIIPDKYNPINTLTESINKKLGTALPATKDIYKRTQEAQAGAAAYPTTRYGTLENAKKTLKEDPFGVGMDLMAVLGITGMGFKGRTIKATPKSLEIMKEQINLIKEAGLSQEAINNIATSKGGELRNIVKDYIKTKPSESVETNVPKIEAIAKIKELARAPEGESIPEGYAERGTKLQNSSDLSQELRNKVVQDPTNIYKKRTWEEANTEADTILKDKPTEAINIASSEFNDTNVSLTRKLIQKLELEGKQTEALNLSNKLRINATKAGQGESALRQFNPSDLFELENTINDRLNLLKQKNPLQFEKIGQAKGIEFRDRGEQIRQMPEGWDKNLATYNLHKDIIRLVPDPISKQILGAYKTVLLGLPKTHAVNIISNITKTALDNLAKYPGTVVDMATSAIKGTPRTMTTPAWSDLLGGTGKGIKEAIKTIKTGYRPGDIPNASGTTSYSHNFVGKAIQTVSDLTFNTLKGEDVASFKGNLEAGLKEQAIVEAKNLGLKNKEIFKNKVNEFVQNPTPRMKAFATKAALESVFQNETLVNDVLTNLSKGTKGMSDFIIPFKKTPASYLSETINYSPAAIGAEAFRQFKSPGKGLIKDQFSFSRNIGKATVGTALGVVLAKTIASQLTGPYPKGNPKEKSLNYLENKVADSIVVKNKQIPTRMMGIGGSIADIVARGASKYKETNDVGEAITAGLLGIPKSILNAPLATGLNDIFKAMEDTEGQGVQKVINLLTSAIGSVVPAINRGLDPYKRYTKSKSWDRLTTGILSKVNPQALPISYDVLGDPRMSEGGVGKQIFDFLSTSNVRNQNNPIVKEFRRLSDAGINPTPTPIDLKEKVAGEKLEFKPMEVSKLQQSIGTETKKALGSFMDSTLYRISRDEEKASKIEKTYSDIKNVKLLMYALQNKLITANQALEEVTHLNSEQKNYLAGNDYKPILDDDSKKVKSFLTDMVKKIMWQKIRSIK